jgi:hypothetical protein
VVEKYIRAKYDRKMYADSSGTDRSGETEVEDPSRRRPPQLPRRLPRLPPRVEACLTCSTSHRQQHPQPPTEAGVLSVPPLPPLPPPTGDGTLSDPRPRLPRLPPPLGTGTRSVRPRPHQRPRLLPLLGVGTRLVRPRPHQPPLQVQLRTTDGMHSCPRRPLPHPPLRQPLLLPRRLTTGAHSRTPPRRHLRLPNLKSQMMTS